MVLVPKYSEKAPSVRMNVPQENSPVVSAPTTRSGGGSRVLMSATCAVISSFRKERICSSTCAVIATNASGGVCATTSRHTRVNANCKNPNKRIALKSLFRIPWPLVLLLTPDARSPAIHLFRGALVFLKPNQIFQQVVLPIDEHRVMRTHAAPVSQNARRCLIVLSHWSQIAVNQRVNHPLARLSITDSLRGIFRRCRKSEQSSG